MRTAVCARNRGTFSGRHVQTHVWQKKNQQKSGPSVLFYEGKERTGYACGNALKSKDAPLYCCTDRLSSIGPEWRWNFCDASTCETLSDSSPLGADEVSSRLHGH